MLDETLLILHTCAEAEAAPVFANGPALTPGYQTRPRARLTWRLDLLSHALQGALWSAVRWRRVSRVPPRPTMQAAREFFSRATELARSVGPAAPVVDEVPFEAYLEEVQRRRLEARAAAHCCAPHFPQCRQCTSRSARCG